MLSSLKKELYFSRCWPLTLTAKTLLLTLSFTFMMGPYEPLAMKPRTWEHKREEKLCFSRFGFRLCEHFVLCQHYLKKVLFRRLTLWELRHKDRGCSSFAAWLLRCLRVRGSAVGSSRPATCRPLIGSLSHRDPVVRGEPMTGPATLTCCLPLHYEQQSSFNGQRWYFSEPKENQIDGTTPKGLS